MSEKPNELESLRTAAEAQLARTSEKKRKPPATEKLLHELQVHQIELDMQNEQLRHSQVELEKSRDRYADFYDFAPVGYLTLNRRGMIDEINLTGAAMLGVARNKLPFRRFANFVAAEDRDRWHRYFLNVLKNDGSLACELTLQHNGRPCFYARLDCLHLKNGDKESVVRIALSDAQLERNHRQVLRDLEYQKYALDQHAIVSITDVHGTITYVNDKFCVLSQYSKDELLGQDHSLINSGTHPKGFFRDMYRTITAGKVWHGDCCNRAKDGSLYWMATTIVPYMGGDGKPFQYVAIRTDITERKRAEEKLHQQQQYANDIINSLPGIFYMLSQQGQFVRVNHQLLEVSGYSKDELDHMTALDFFAGDDKNLISQKMLEAFELGNSFAEAELITKSGRKIPYYFTGHRTSINDQIYIIGLGTDITERKQIDEALRVAAATFETHDAIVITDARANIVRVNRAFTDITGYSQEEVLGQNPRIMNSGRQDRAFYIEMWQQLLHIGSWAGEIWDKRKSGQIYPKWLTISAVKNEHQETTHYVAIFSDITARKQAEEEIHNLAFYDSLTKLPNRRLFLDRFRAALAASARRDDYGAVLFIDLDRFKALNDTLGHDYGDLLLIEVGMRIKSCVREMDTVARFGGDEFVVLIEAIGNDRDDATFKVSLVAEKIREVLSQSYKLKEHEHHSSPSIGISLYHGHDEPMDVLIEHADMAMYQVKNSGRNGVRFFDPVMQHNVATHDALDNDLHYAIELQQLYLHYQIQVDNDNRPLGAEAFLRWHHPERGLIMPGQFLPIAEESPLILEIGHWVLQTACHQLALWSKNKKTRDLTLTVNISAKHFAKPDFVSEVAGILKEQQADPTHLKLELSERLVMADINSTMDKINALKKLGVRLTMDNFGTVYSSLSYLKQLSSDQLKIHQEFVQGITLEGNDAQLIQTVIDLAKSMDLDVFAEGVETEEQRAFLKNHDCNAYQGYLFGKPVPIEEFDTVIEQLFS